MAEESNKDKGESLSQTKGYRYKRDAETQNKQDAKDINPTVMGNNNKESIASLSEVLINQNSITGAETKDDVTTIDIQINCDSIDVLLESVTHHSSSLSEEGKDDMAIIGMQVNHDIVDPLAELLIHLNSFIIEEEAKDITTQNNIMINNNSESLIVGMSTGSDKQAQTTHNKKRKGNKNKNIYRQLVVIRQNK